MLYKIRILAVALLICGAKCSQVIDIHTQKGLNISDYCPRIGECAEGSHVMCVYNSGRIMGPACYDFLTNITITADYAQMILSIINRIRSRIANGLVKAKDGLLLPKGYGIHRVSWDEELATFAQVWANQCILRLDLCRSSKRFPSAGQALGITRFSLDDWMPVHRADFNDTVLTPQKVKYALRSVMKAWWSMKEEITADDVKEFNRSVPELNRNKFSNLAFGPLTHVGCGISVYKEYAYKDNLAHLIFNCIQIVCNFSSRPKKPIFTVEPPTQPGYTVRCGCPLGYDEDEDCLCYESGRKMPCKDKDQCKPSVVVLPIFTVEDASISPSRQKQSIFSKAGIFELPIKRKQLKMNLIPQTKEIQNDVKPRKDFTKVQEIVSKYLDEKRNGKTIIVDINSGGDIAHGPVTLKSSTIQKLKENTIHENHNFNSTTVDLNYSTTQPVTESDIKLMSLLDKLEEEVKRIDLNTHEKGLFDEKIRKIYGTLVGKLNIVEQKLKLRNRDSTNQSINRDSEFINADNYDFNFNKPKHNYRDFENSYNSLNNYENKVDRVYNKNNYYNDKKSFLRGIDENLEERKLRNTYDVRENVGRNIMSRHSRLEGDDYYPLSSERRRYYHQKLANLQKKINNIKRSGHRKDQEKLGRRIRNSIAKAGPAVGVVGQATAIAKG
ncbi:uncharacterized protein LOC112055360 [Bicyclus anynana]|uniref:Uncharacterized protein LOC112055360 n=1 Tax=Bicyclus anynana TaxID=110368 RepID=A0ABM3M0J6_BICAN|nr:uncharacterized protein LOC112055360 [Bicyclus anynana]